jgi:ABC-type sugar transport system substrate-binding protein
MKKIIMLSLCVLMVFVAFTACSSTDQAATSSEAASQEAADAPASASEAASDETAGGTDEGVKIAYINALVTTPYFGYLDSAMTEHAQELGVDLQILDGQADNQVMLDQAQSLIDQQDIDAIIFTPCDMAGSVSIVQAISDAGIPLIICNTRVDESVEDLTQSLICCDPTYEGEVVGQLAVEQCPEGGKCITLEGFAGQEAQIYRTEGFKNGIEGSNIEIVDQKICDWDKAKAMTATDDMITAYPDLAIIFAQDDTMAEGAIEAVKAAGKEDQIKVFGLGYMGDESKEALLSGELCGTCTQSPSWEGVTSLDVALAVLNGDSVESWYKTECLPVTKENCESIDHGYNS